MVCVVAVFAPAARSAPGLSALYAGAVVQHGVPYVFSLRVRQGRVTEISFAGRYPCSKGSGYSYWTQTASLANLSLPVAPAGTFAARNLPVPVNGGQTRARNVRLTISGRAGGALLVGTFRSSLAVGHGTCATGLVRFRVRGVVTAGG